MLARLGLLTVTVLSNATRKVNSLRAKVKSRKEFGHLNKSLVGHLKFVKLKDLGLDYYHFY